MKTIGTFFLALLFIGNIAFAQDTMYVYNTGGVITKFATNQIDSIIFYAPITPPSGAGCGAQLFALTNLNVGIQISQATTQINNGITEKWCYNNVAANCVTYGGLYQWNEAMNYAASSTCDPCGAGGVQGQCPAGYHVPTDLEWSRYEYCIENNIAPTGTTSLATFQTTTNWRGSATAGVGPGAKMKATSSNTPAWDGTNTSGFNALPAGYSGGGSSGIMGTYTYLWSATENNSTNAWRRYLNSGNVQSGRSYNAKTTGFSVRCLQD